MKYVIHIAGEGLCVGPFNTLQAAQDHAKAQHWDSTMLDYLGLTAPAIDKIQPYRPLTAEELEALQYFASVFGRKWKSILNEQYWYNARIFYKNGSNDSRTGSLLHGLRNSHGPSWLHMFKLPE